MDHSPGECPVCHKALSSGDDVVICPDCGAPYHRACYQQAGHCLFQAQHGGGFEYKSPAQKKAEAAGIQETATSGILCKSCNTVNDARNIFCEKCGAPLHAPAPEGPSAGGPAGGVWPPQNAQPPFYGQTVYGPQMDYSGEIDGISKRDWAQYIGRSADTYVYRLAQMSRRGGKVSFMFSAFFLGPFYFAFRKMWGWAALALVLSLGLSIPYALLLLTQLGVPVVAAGSLDLLATVTDVCSLVSWVVNIATGLFALQLYRMSARKRIHALREQYSSDGDYHAALAARGGISIPGVVVIVALLFAASIALYFTTGNVLGQALSAAYTQALAVLPPIL